MIFSFIPNLHVALLYWKTCQKRSYIESHYWVSSCWFLNGSKSYYHGNCRPNNISSAGCPDHTATVDICRSVAMLWDHVFIYSCTWRHNHMTTILLQAKLELDINNGSSVKLRLVFSPLWSFVFCQVRFYELAKQAFYKWFTKKKLYGGSGVI